MNYRSKIFIFSGLYALLALFLAKELVYSYNYGAEGINLLPIDFFEFVLFAIVVFTLLIILITISVLVKKSNHSISYKKRFHLLIPSFMGLIIIFLLFKGDYSNLVVPISIIIYGLILLNLNRFVTSRLLILGMLILLLGIAAFFINNWNWQLLVVVFGILPILFGILIKLRPSTNS